MTRDVNVLIPWLLTVVVIAAIGATTVPIIYAFLPWRKHLIGRMFMLQAITLAAAIDMSIVMYFWRPKDILIIFWFQVLIYTGIAVSTTMLAYATLRTRYPPKHRRSFKLLFNPGVYEFLKRLVQIILPAAGALYFGLAQLWNFPNVAAVVGTLSLLATFLGLCLGISTKEYNRQEPRYDGVVSIVENEDGQQAHFQDIDPKAILEKDRIVFKVNK